MLNGIFSWFIRSTILIVNWFFRPYYRPCQIYRVGDYNVAFPNTPTSCKLTHKVYLLTHDNRRYDITQPAGTKYPYTPMELGGDEYIIQDPDGNETRTTEQITVNMAIKRRKLM